MRLLFFPILLVFFFACNSNEDAQYYGSGVLKDTIHHTMQSLMVNYKQQMMATPKSGTDDKDFASLMRIHHEGSLHLARLLLEKGKNNELKNIAKSIMIEQQKEIAMFNSYLSHATPSAKESDQFFKEVMMQMNNMHLPTDKAPTIDHEFTKLMILHLQAAIDMSNTYLDTGGKDQKLSTMAGKIIEDKRKEILQLEDWLDKNK